ncbi:MAG TPA: polysaccharide deacetylase family protein [Candidatus Excrementavichristensenella intestinipullorum]|nr:polysaccharide deacetylase family protein [Candidatus Excrementavichristensenella intestinipullorum]
MKRNDWRSYASGRHRKKRPSRRGKFLFPLGAVALALVLVMGVPYLLAQASLDAVISAAAATASPTRMPLWTAQPAAPTPSPTPQPTPQPTPVPAPGQAASAQPDQPDPQGKMIALTFDDGPGVKATARILAALEEVGGRATFFMLGENAAAHPDLARQVAQAGHLVGTHTNSHKSLIRLTAKEMLQEVELSLDNIQKATGVRPAILRPPYGNVNDLVKQTLDLPLVNWSVDTRDWDSRDAQKVYDHILANVRDGDIVLMHDIYDSTAEAVEMVLPELVKRGYQLVTVEELFAYKGLSLKAGKVYYNGR